MSSSWRVPISWRLGSLAVAVLISVATTLVPAQAAGPAQLGPIDTGNPAAPVHQTAGPITKNRTTPKKAGALIAVSATINGTLGSGSPDYPSTSGTTANRLFRNGASSACGSPKTFPGTIAGGGPYAYDAYTFTNGPNAACVTTTVTGVTCVGPLFVFPATYAPTFDPTNLATNYVGDSGLSPNTGAPVSYSFTAAANSNFVIVIGGVSPSSTGCTYQLKLSGISTANTLTVTANPNTIYGGHIGSPGNYPSPGAGNYYPLATFNDPNNGVVNNYQTVVTWADGSTTTCTGTVCGSADVKIACTDPQDCSVTGLHSYTAAGRYQPQVRVTETNNGNFQAITDYLYFDLYVTGNCSGVSPATAAQCPMFGIVNGNADQPQSGPVAFFTDGDAPPGSSFTVSIDYGDGTAPSPPTSLNCFNGCVVNGTHTYAMAGSYQVVTTVTDNNDAIVGTNGCPATPNGRATCTPVTWSVVEVNDLGVTGGDTFNATEGQQQTGIVARVTDPDRTNSTPLDFAATINWGDGSSTSCTVTGPTACQYSTGSATGSPTTIQFINCNPSFCDVQGTHTYLEASPPGSPYTITVTVTDADQTTQPASVTSQAIVAEAALTSLATGSFTGTEGQTPPANSFYLGTFHDAVNSAAACLASEYTASTIYTPSTYVASQAADTVVTSSQVPGTCNFDVYGSAVFDKAGTYTGTTTVQEADNAAATVTLTATGTIADAALTASPAAAGQTCTESASCTFTAGSFTDANSFCNQEGVSTSAHYTVIVTYADATTSPGTVIENGLTCTFTVTATHTFTTLPGTQPVNFCVTDTVGGAMSCTTTPTIITVTQPTQSTPCVSGRCPSATASFTNRTPARSVSTFFRVQESSNSCNPMTTTCTTGIGQFISAVLSFHDSLPTGLNIPTCNQYSPSCNVHIDAFQCTTTEAASIFGTYTYQGTTHFFRIDINDPDPTPTPSPLPNDTFTITTTTTSGAPFTYTLSRPGITELLCPLAG